MAVPHLLAGVVQKCFEERDDIEVVAEHPGLRGLADAIERTRANVILWGLGQWALQELAELLAARPRLEVVAVDPAGGAGLTMQVLGRAELIDDAGPDDLAAAVRRAGDRLVRHEESGSCS